MTSAPYVPTAAGSGPPRGAFVVFEGGEGSGKSTQAHRLAHRRGAILTREPGGTAIGVEIRQILLHPDTDPVSPRAEALLMAADRAHHVATKIEPALAAGSDVVSDRFMASSMAYQGAGRRLGVETVAELSRFAVAGLVPDLIVLLDVPVDIGNSRAGDRGRLDKLEQEGAAFHERVRQAFLSFAAEARELWVVIDGTQPEDVVASHVDEAVASRLGW